MTTQRIHRIIVAEAPMLYLRVIFAEMPPVKMMPLDAMYVRLEISDEVLQHVHLLLREWEVRIVCVDDEAEMVAVALDAEKRRKQEFEYLLVQHLLRSMIIERCLERLSGTVAFERIEVPYENGKKKQGLFKCLKWTLTIRGALANESFTNDVGSWVQDCFFVMLYLGYLKNHATKDLAEIWSGREKERVLTALGKGVPGTVLDVHHIGEHPIYHVLLKEEWKGNTALWLNAQQVLPTLPGLLLHASDVRTEARHYKALIESAIQRIKMKREALQEDRKGDVGLSAHTITPDEQTLQAEILWLKANGFPVILDEHQVRVSGLDELMRGERREEEGW